LFKRFNTRVNNWKNPAKMNSVHIGIYAVSADTWIESMRQVNPRPALTRRCGAVCRMN